MLTLLQQNPALPLLAAGMSPDAWQGQLLHSTAARILLLCSRQAGKSTAAAALALRVALLTPRSLVLLCSPSLRQSGELFRKVVDLFNALSRPVAVTTASSLRLELANGSRIISLPAQEETIRGYSGVSLLVIDEAARVADALYRSVRPMLAVSQGRIVALSTPFGKRGWFYEEWQGPGAWERYRVPAVAVPRIRPEFLEQEHASLGEAWFRQEYGCDFTMRAGLVYPELADCVVEPGDLPPIDRSFAGVDFGFHNPAAVVFGCKDKDDVLWIVEEVYAARMTDEELIRRIKPLVERYRTELLWCDPSAPRSIEKMRRANLPARLAINNVSPGIRAVTARLRTRRLKVWRTCQNLITEAELYCYPEETDTAIYRRDQPIKENDHAMDALRYLIAGMDRVRGVDDWHPEVAEPEAPPVRPAGPWKLSAGPIREVEPPEIQRERWQEEQQGWESVC
jgi:phage terminase large subunit